jgi:hypothetical protein
MKPVYCKAASPLFVAIALVSMQPSFRVAIELAITECEFKVNQFFDMFPEVSRIDAASRDCLCLKRECKNDEIFQKTRRGGFRAAETS